MGVRFRRPRRERRVTPRRKSRHVSGTQADARSRRAEADLLLERVGLGDAGDPRSRKVDVAIAVMAGIAYADAICLAALGERSASADHADAVALLQEVDSAPAASLQVLISLKTQAQYGVGTLSEDEAKRAMRAVHALRGRAVDL